jgi:hypothetical protein
MSKVEIPDEKIIEAIEWLSHRAFETDDIPLMLAEYAQEQIKLLNLDFVVGRSGQLCDHKGTTIAWGPDADKCTKCDLTWDV